MNLAFTYNGMNGSNNLAPKKIPPSFYEQFNREMKTRNPFSLIDRQKEIITQKTTYKGLMGQMMVTTKTSCGSCSKK